MKLSTAVLSSAILALGLVITGFTLKGGIDNMVNRDRQVTVRGLCEKEVAANKVTWPIVTKEVGNDLSAIYTRIQQTNNTVKAFLLENGITADEISFSAPAVYDLQAERYSNSDNRFRYQVTNVVVVTSAQVDTVRALIERQTELMRQGIAVVAGDYNYQTVYEYTDLNSIKPQMIAEATAAAREAADKFAADAGSPLGKIRTASQGQFSIENRDQYTPNIKTVRVVTSITYSLGD